MDPSEMLSGCRPEHAGAGPDGQLLRTESVLDRADSKARSLTFQDELPLDVLVIDDHELLRIGLIQLFDAEGLRAIGASSATDALRLIERGVWPAVVLLDLAMPGMNGWEFIDSLQKVRGLPPIPIVIVSGVEWFRTPPRRNNDGGFFKKPVRFDMLLASVKKLLPGRGRRESNPPESDQDGPHEGL